jgi:four helix bundle protein
MQVFNLIMDVRRAAMGITTNLTEGQNRAWSGESEEFIKIAQENLAELRRQLLLAKDNMALSETGVEGLLQQINNLEGSLQRLATSLA